MNLDFTPEETRLLLHHLAERIRHLDADLVHTDKRELQRSLAGDLQKLRSLLDRVRAAAARDGEKEVSDSL